MSLRRNRLRRMKSRGHTVQELSMTPLVDVALTLLIIFMVATPMMKNVIKVELPSSRMDDQLPISKDQQELTVYIDKDRKFYFNGAPLSLEALLKQLKTVVKKSQDEIVFVKADQSVPYGKVIDLVDTIKVSGGIKYVALATKRAV